MCAKKGTRNDYLHRKRSCGFRQKQELVDYLTGQGYDVIDRGPDSDDRVDYPDYAAAVAHDVSGGTADRGVLVCGTGIGMALAADKVVGVRAANVINVQFAELCRQHNDANVVTLSGRFVELEENKKIVDAFLATKFEGGRHAMRVAKIMKLDAEGGATIGADGNVRRA